MYILSICKDKFIVIKKYDQEFLIILGQIIEMKQTGIMTK